jgi:hypothetical protein
MRGPQRIGEIGSSPRGKKKLYPYQDSLVFQVEIGYSKFIRERHLWVFYLQLGRIYVPKIVGGQFRVDKEESGSIKMIVSKPSPLVGWFSGAVGHIA